MAQAISVDCNDVLIKAIADYQNLIEVLSELIEDVEQEHGLEKQSVLPHAQWRKTIAHLRKQIEKQDKWLTKRREEVSVLQESIRVEREKKNYYKEKYLDRLRAEDTKIDDLDF